MQHRDGMHKLALAALIATSALVVITASFWGARLYAQHRNQAQQVPTPVNAAMTGFPLPAHPAPDFTLVNQFNQPVKLSSMRGREVVLAFIDSRCTTICPLTAQIMYAARAHLGSAAGQVALVAVNANPSAPNVTEVQSWSIKHGMLHQWLFLTGTPQQLQAVYSAYQIYAKVDASGEAVHDPALFIIDAQGREQLYFETLNSNTQPDLLNEETGLQIGMQQWLPKS